MYSHLLPSLADERARDIRQDATTVSLIRLARGARVRHAHAAPPCPEPRLTPGAARA